MQSIKKNFSLFTTQLSNLDEKFDVTRVLIRDPQELIVAPGVTINKVAVGCRNANSSEGHLMVILPPGAFTFGVKENKDPSTGRLTGYSFSVKLWSQTSPPDVIFAGRAWLSRYSQVCLYLKRNLQSKLSDKIASDRLGNDNFERFDKVYDSPDDDSSPTLYFSLKYFRERGVTTMMRDAETNKELTLEKVLGKRARISGCLDMDCVLFTEKRALFRICAHELRFTIEPEKIEFMSSLVSREPLVTTENRTTNGKSLRNRERKHW